MVTGSDIISVLNFNVELMASGSIVDLNVDE